jgi:hypothetical protein
VKTNKLLTAGSAVALAAMPAVASACDACMGAKDPGIRPAVNGAIFFMLAIVVLMATGIGFFMRHLSKRANAPTAPHDELVQLMSKGPSNV